MHTVSFEQEVVPTFLKGLLELAPLLQIFQALCSSMPERPKSTQRAAAGGRLQASQVKWDRHPLRERLLGTGFLGHLPLGTGRCPWLCWLTTKCHHLLKAPAP